jgi:hypothetical protein
VDLLVDISPEVYAPYVIIPSADKLNYVRTRSSLRHFTKDRNAP